MDVIQRGRTKLKNGETNIFSFYLVTFDPFISPFIQIRTVLSPLDDLHEVLSPVPTNVLPCITMALLRYSTLAPTMYMYCK
jgi:hypothetical protein